jgi:ankyrin repeat protein
MKKVNINTLLAVILLTIGLNTQAMDERPIEEIIQENRDLQLFLATKEGDEAKVKALINHGANVNFTQKKSGLTPLIIAAENGHLGIVKALLDHNADANAWAYGFNGLFALTQASFNGHTAIVRLLIEKGANVNMRTTLGLTALISAAQNGHEEIVKMLLEHGADPDAQAKKEVGGMFPLRQAAVEGHNSIVQLLLRNEASINMQDAHGANPLIFASQNGHLETVLTLLKHGANAFVQAPGYHNIFALKQAARNGHLAIAVALLTYLSAADAAEMRETYFALAHSMRTKKTELPSIPVTRRLVLQTLIDTFIQQRMAQANDMIVLQDNNKETARNAALRNHHPAIADLLDLNNRKSQEFIRTQIERVIRRALALRPTNKEKL